jgi:hypothetical protein
MSFLVQARLDDHRLSVPAATEKEAFAKAIEWHKSGRFTSISIHESTKGYSIEAFALAKALVEIGKTVDGASEETDEIHS